MSDLKPARRYTVTLGKTFQNSLQSTSFQSYSLKCKSFQPSVCDAALVGGDATRLCLPVPSTCRFSSPQALLRKRKAQGATLSAVSRIDAEFDIYHILQRFPVAKGRGEVRRGTFKKERSKDARR